MRKLISSLVFASLIGFAQAQTEDISFPSGEITLSGTLIKPRGVEEFSVVVFVHGSGPSTGSDFKQLARRFVKLGYGALTYDKRGAGKSGGDPKLVDRFSLIDLSNDVLAAVDFAGKDVRVKSIGLYGASQGGWVAPLAASKTDKIKFMIIQSGSVTTIGEDNIFERSARLITEGFSEPEVAEAREMHVVDIAFTRDPSAREPFLALWGKNKAKKWFPRVYAGEGWLSPNGPYRVWYRTVVDFDPVPLWEKLSIPVLWLYGEAALDQYCPVEQSIAALSKLKEKGKDFEVKFYPGANHSLLVGKKQVAIAEEAGAWLRRKGM